VADEPSKGCAPEATDKAGRLASVAREASGVLIANLGFALEEISALRVELDPSCPKSGEDQIGQLGRAQSALHAVEEALKTARRGADQVRQVARDLERPLERSSSPTSRGEGDERDVPPQHASDRPQTPRGSVLVVDDEPMIVRAIQRLIEGEHDVCLSTDPVAVVEQVRAGRRFDVILCDIMMPTMSGIDVYDAIRQMDPEQARRMVFMTGGAFTPRVLEFLEATENARIEKPLERSTLRAAIRAQMSS
jgi:CheY-like chemotaxis protein